MTITRTFPLVRCCVPSKGLQCANTAIFVDSQTRSKHFCAGHGGAAFARGVALHPFGHAPRPPIVFCASDAELAEARRLADERRLRETLDTLLFRLWLMEEDPDEADHSVAA